MGWTGIKPYQYRPNAVLVNPDSGKPQRDGIDLLLSLYNRTGGGNGSPNQVTQEAVTANGATIDDAAMLTQDWNEVTTTSSGQGVQIPSFSPGGDITVFNSGSDAVNVYPPDTDTQIDDLGNGAAYSLAAGDKQTFQCWSPTQFRSGA